MDTSPQKPICSTQSAHIITIRGIMRTSAPAKPLGSYVHAKDRMKGAVRCTVFITNQRLRQRYGKTNDTRRLPCPQPGEDDPYRCPFTPRSLAQHGYVA
ncbi:MAG: hypothetical protein OXC62_16170 [Aestuariivita sp.]|nr:hypothetical protein [Aestuariivita sp.]